MWNASKLISDPFHCGGTTDAHDQGYKVGHTVLGQVPLKGKSWKSMSGSRHTFFSPVEHGEEKVASNVVEKHQ